MRAWIFVVILSLLTSNFARAAEPVDVNSSRDWKTFDSAMSSIADDDRAIGTSYLISGGLVTLGSIAGYYSTDDSTSKVIYAFSQSLGIAAIGYGSAKLFIGHEYSSFYAAVKGTNLSNEQKNNLLRIYLENEKEKRESLRKIKIATHLLLGAVNLYSATREKDNNVKSVFTFLSGINFAIALAYTF